MVLPMKTFHILNLGAGVQSTGKKAPPSFPLFPSDLLVGTALMDDQELGAYTRLLCYQWEHGSLPNDIGLLSRLVRNPPISERVMAKFKLCDDAELRNQRMEIERQKLVNPTLNPKSTQPLTLGLPEALRRDGFPEAWADYEGHRIERNEPLTSYTRRQLFLKCERLGAKKAVAMIRETIDKSRKSLYEPHELNGFNGKPQEPKETLTQRWQRDNPQHLTFGEWRVANNC
jgi:hypothetical protein